MTPILVPGTPEIAEQLGAAIRPADRDAILGMGYETVATGLGRSLGLSTRTWALVDADGPLAIAGVTGDEQVWLACAARAGEKPKTLWRTVRDTLEEILRGRRSVWTVCDEEDRLAAHFLERLGFHEVNRLTVNKTRHRFILMGRLA